MSIFNFNLFSSTVRWELIYQHDYDGHGQLLTWHFIKNEVHILAHGLLSHLPFHLFFSHSPLIYAFWGTFIFILSETLEKHFGLNNISVRSSSNIPITCSHMCGFVEWEIWQIVIHLFSYPHFHKCNIFCGFKLSSEVTVILDILDTFGDLNQTNSILMSRSRLGPHLLSTRLRFQVHAIPSYFPRNLRDYIK